MKSKKFLAILLYCFPIIFYAICYFLIITSGEDIWQGANTKVDIVGDALAAFNHSVRLADMFAWAIINFFDYHFQFGPDLIFRLIDLATALTIFYLATYIVVRRPPRLKLSDALVFCAIFLMVNFSSNGFTLYAGFSLIHNYLFITFFTLAFGIFYLQDIWRKETAASSTSLSLRLQRKHPYLFALFMLVLGFIFGFASNVTAIVFLLALVIYTIYAYIRHRKKLRQQNIHTQKAVPNFKSQIKNFIFSWRFTGVIGILLSIALMYLVGSGLGDYDTNPAYRSSCDYLPIGELLENPLAHLGRIFEHNLYNFGRFFLPFILLTVVIAIIFIILRKKPNFTALKPHRNFLVASLIFIIMHIFAMSQIIYPTRLVFPAYIFACAIYIFILLKLCSNKDNEHTSTKKIKPQSKTSSSAITAKTQNLLALTFSIGAIILIAVRAYLAINYISKITPILNDIKNSSETVYCVNYNDAFSKQVPYLHLGQEAFLEDWAMPQTIYNKHVIYCD